MAALWAASKDRAPSCSLETLLPVPHTSKSVLILSLQPLPHQVELKVPRLTQELNRERLTGKLGHGHISHEAC